MYRESAKQYLASITQKVSLKIKISYKLNLEPKFGYFCSRPAFSKAKSHLFSEQSSLSPKAPEPGMELDEMPSCTVVQETETGRAVYKLCHTVKLLEESVVILKARNINLENRIEQLMKEMLASRAKTMIISTDIQALIDKFTQGRFRVI